MCFLVWWKSFWHLENKDVLQPIYYCPTWPEKLKNLPYNRSSYLNHITLAIIAFACSRNIDNNYTFDDWKTLLKLMIKTKRKNLQNNFFEIGKVKNKICMEFNEILYSISIGISTITCSFKSIKCKIKYLSYFVQVTWVLLTCLIRIYLHPIECLSIRILRLTRV